MKNLLLTFILLVFLPVQKSYAQDLETLKSSLDSIRNEKLMLQQKLEEYNLLEKEYNHLISEVDRASSAGKYYRVKYGTVIYKTKYLTGEITKLNRGDVLKVLSTDEMFFQVQYGDIVGYASTLGIEELKDQPKLKLDTSASIDLLPISEGERIKHAYYTIAYSEEHEQANWVFYKLNTYMLGGNTSRTDNFRIDDFVSTGSATLADYKGSGYDRGHLCPAGDMVTDLVAMSESFFMSNMSPQDPGFNRGIWKTLEGAVRNWALDEQEVYVVTGPVFKDNIGTIGNGVTVPGYFYKVIYDPTDVQKMIAFVLPNRKGEKQLPEYAVTVDYVENITGIDFFSGLADDLESELESKIATEDWKFEVYNASVSKETATQCKGTAKSTGQQCRNKTTNENGYCYLHQGQAPGGEQKVTERRSTSVQCNGTTQKGARCKNKTLNANGYCHLHQNQASSNSVNKTKSTTTRSTYSGGRTIYTGPRGGKYYINKNGNKTYIKK